jgi:hypothetical protein
LEWTPYWILIIIPPYYKDGTNDGTPDGQDGYWTPTKMAEIRTYQEKMNASQEWTTAKIDAW